LVSAGVYNTSLPTVTNGQTVATQMDAAGRTFVDLGAVGATTVVNGGVAGSLAIGGNAANNASTAGNPVQVSVLAGSAEPTAATNGQNASLFSDLRHKLIVLPYANPENMVQGTVAGNISTTPGSSLLGAVSSNYLYVTSLSCTNSGSANALVSFTDGSAGTVIYQMNAVAGGGFVNTFPTPIFGKGTGGQSAAGHAIYVYVSTTTNTAVSCNASGYSGT